MEKDNQGKVAIVTGGGSGIGLAIAKKFVDANIITIIVGRDKQRLKLAKETMGASCFAVYCDLSDLNSIPKMVEQVIYNHGRIDILVNNAGINLKKDFTQVTDEEFQKILLTNVTGVFVLSREVVKSMLPQGGGTIVNISSMASRYGLPKVIAYTASKSAIEGMTRAMAVELSPAGIRVNCIAPGFIITDMTEKAFRDDINRKQKVLARTPMGVLGEASDIGEAALFLATSPSKYITGTVLPVDGGNSIGF